MRNPLYMFGSRRNRRLGAIGTFAVAAPIVLGLLVAAQSQAHSQAQSTSAVSAPKFEYEVASIKPNKSGRGSSSWRDTPDGFTATNSTLLNIIQSAYGVRDYQISGAPEWLNSERYDIDAKMDGAVADALNKLTRDDRILARQRMLQALFADRFKLTIHRETKDLPEYSLVIAKNGPKFKEAKPGDTYANGSKGRDGVPLGTGSMMTRGSQTGTTMTVQAIPISSLVETLSGSLDRPVLDKTGLTAKYDFTLTYSTDQAQLQALAGSAVNGQPSPAPPDTSGPSLFTALQEQLGLKLEPGKGPVEVIVIDHVERPSGN